MCFVQDLQQNKEHENGENGDLGKQDFSYYTRARGHDHTAHDITSWLPTMEFAEKKDYDELEPSSYTGDIEALFKAQADSEAIEDRITEDPFRITRGLDAQNIFAAEDDDDNNSWSESALIQEQLRKIRDRGDRLRADREARLLQQQHPPPPPPPLPSGNHDHDHQYSKTNISSPEENPHHIFDTSSPFTDNMLPRLILLLVLLLLLFSAISTKKFSKPYKSRSKPFPKFMNKINIHHLPPPLRRLLAKDKKISALPSPLPTKITSRLQFQFHLLYKKTIFPHLPIIPLPTLQRHCFSLARKFLIGYIFLLLAAPFGRIALASYRNRVVLWRDLEGFEVPYYLLVEEERRGCW